MEREALDEIRRILQDVSNMKGPSERRVEFEQWTESLYENVSNVKEDVKELQVEMKKMTATLGDIHTDVEVLKNEKEHAKERHDELKAMLEDIQKNGCLQYTKHRKYLESGVSKTVELPKLEDLKGRTWADLFSKLSTTEIVLLSTIAFLLFFYFGGVNYLGTLLGIG